MEIKRRPGDFNVVIDIFVRRILNGDRQVVASGAGRRDVLQKLMRRVKDLQMGRIEG